MHDPSEILSAADRKKYTAEGQSENRFKNPKQNDGQENAKHPVRRGAVYPKRKNHAACTAYDNTIVLSAISSTDIPA